MIYVLPNLYMMVIDRTSDSVLGSPAVVKILNYLFIFLISSIFLSLVASSFSKPLELGL